MTKRHSVGQRAVLLSALLLVGCAMLPSLEPALVQYVVRTDWTGVPLEAGERVFETDLGYVVGVSKFELRTTSIELLPCQPPLALLDPRPTRVFAHSSAYDHDVSVIEPGVLDDLMVEQAQLLGRALTTRSSYCELFSVHGTGRDELVTSIAGWYRAPNSTVEVPFVAEHPLGVTGLAPLAVGTFDDSLLPDEAQVTVTSFPAHAFDGLVLTDLPEIDIAYEATLTLLRTRDIQWTIGPPSD